MLVAVAYCQASNQIHPGDAGWKRAYTTLNHMVVWKIAESASDTLAWECLSANEGCWIAYSISGANDLEIITSDTQTLDPQSLTPGAGAQDYLWIATLCNFGGAATAPTSAITNYSNLKTATVNTTRHVASCQRTLNAASEDPGTWTVSAQGNRSTTTIAVWDRGTTTVRRRFKCVNYPTGSSSPLVGGDRLFTTDGWDGFRAAGNTTIQFATDNGADGNDGVFVTGVQDNTDDAAYGFQWSGTLEELGIPSGSTVSGISDASFYYKVTNYNASAINSWWLGANAGTGDAMEFFDGTSTHELVPATQITGNIGFTKLSMSTPVTGLTLASTQSVNIDLTVSVDQNAGSFPNPNVVFDEIELVFDLQSSGGDYASTTTATSTVSAGLTVSTSKVRRLGTPTTYSGTSGNDFSTSVTPLSGSNRLVIATFTAQRVEFNSTGAITCTWDGTAGTEIYSNTNNYATHVAFYWKEADIPSSASTMSFSIGGLNEQTKSLVVSQFENVDQDFSTLDTGFGSDTSSPFAVSFTVLESTIPRDNVILQSVHAGRQTSGGASLSFSVTGDGPRSFTGDIFASGSTTRTRVATIDSCASATGISNNDLGNLYDTYSDWTVGTSSSGGWTSYRSWWIEIPAGVVSGGDYLSTTTATSTVSGVLEVSRDMIAAPAATSTVSGIFSGTTLPLQSTTTVASTVTGNIDPTRILISATAVTSVLGPTPNLAVTRNIVSTTNSASTLTANFDIDAFMQSNVAATSTVTPSLEVTRPLISTTTATSTASGFFETGEPYISATVTTVEDNLVTTFSPTLPTHVAGDLLVVFVGMGDNGTCVRSSYLDGWKWNQSITLGSTDAMVGVAYKIATSGSETLTLNRGVNERFKSIAYTVKNVDDANHIFYTSEHGGLFTTSNSAPFEQIVMDKQREALSFVAVATSQDAIGTAAPTNYGNLTTLQGSAATAYGSLSTAYANINTTTEAPANMPLSSVQGHATITFIVYKRDSETETSFQKRFNFNDSTSSFETDIFGNTIVIDDVWTSPNWQNVEPVPASTSGGPTGRVGDDESFTTMRFEHGAGGATYDNYVEFVGTWADLGVGSNEGIVSIDDVSFWYNVDIAGTGSIRFGSAANDAIEITDVNGTHTLVPKQTPISASQGFLEETATPNLKCDYLATDPITIRIYGEVASTAAGVKQIRIDDLHFNLTTIPNPNLFSLSANKVKRLTPWTRIGGANRTDTGIDEEITIPSGKNRLFLFSYGNGDITNPPGHPTFGPFSYEIGTGEFAQIPATGALLYLTEEQLAQMGGSATFTLPGQSGTPGGNPENRPGFGWYCFLENVEQSTIESINKLENPWTNTQNNPSTFADTFTDNGAIIFQAALSRNHSPSGTSPDFNILTYTGLFEHDNDFWVQADLGAIDNITMKWIGDDLSTNLTNDVFGTKSASYQIELAGGEPGNGSIAWAAFSPSDSIDAKLFVNATLTTQRTFSATVNATSSLTVNEFIRTPMEESTTSGSTSHPIALPAHQSGDLLFAIFTYDFPGVIPSSWTAGWEIYETSQSITIETNEVAISVFYKVATSASESLTITTNVSTNSASHAYNALDKDNLQINYAPASQPVSPILDMERSDVDYLVIAAAGVAFGSIGDLDDNYQDPVETVATGSNPGLKSYRKQVSGIDTIVGDLWFPASTIANVGITVVLWKETRFKRLRWTWPQYDGDTLNGWTFTTTSGSAPTITSQTRVQTLVGGDGANGSLRVSQSNAATQGYLEITVDPAVDLGLTATDKIIQYTSQGVDREQTQVVGGTTRLLNPGATTSFEVIDSATRSLFGNGFTGNRNWERIPSGGPLPVSAPFIPNTQLLTFRLYFDIDASAGGTAYIEVDNLQVDIDFTTERLYETTVAATSTVTSSLEVDRPLDTTVAATTTATSNVEINRAYLSATAITSVLGPTPSLVVDRPLISASSITSTVDANLGIKFELQSTTNVVSTVNPNQFYYGFECSLSATSTVTADLLVQRPLLSATIAQSAVVGPTRLQRQVDWNSVTSVASTVFLGNMLVDRPLRADFNGFSVTVANMQLAGKMQSVVTATSAIDPTELERLRGYESTTTVTSDVGGNIVEGLRFVSATVAQSGVVLPTNLEVLRDMITPIVVVSTVDQSLLQRAIEWDTTLNVASTVIGTIVVITNTLELTWTSGEYFYEPEPYVIRLTSDTYDDTVTVNEILTPIQLSDGDVLDPMVINSDDDGPA